MPAIEVSRPDCGKGNIIDMKLHEPLNGGFVEFLSQIVGDIGIKHYAFSGNGHCAQCGKIIDVCVNVANQKKKEGIPWVSMQAIQQ